MRRFLKDSGTACVYDRRNEGETMRHLSALAIVTLLTVASDSFAQWKIAPGPLVTRWAKDVDPARPLPEYPRPQMVRENWTNLNGLWDYTISDKDASAPTAWEG